MPGSRKFQRAAPILFITTAAIMVLAVAGISTVLRWTEYRATTPAEAMKVFDALLNGRAAGPPYVEINGEGRVGINHALERKSPVSLDALHVLAWDAEGAFLLESTYPWWYVRLKLTEIINLGTLVTALVGDWESINLKLTEEDLERRGPGRIIDHTLADGSRIIVWTE